MEDTALENLGDLFNFCTMRQNAYNKAQVTACYLKAL